MRPIHIKKSTTMYLEYWSLEEKPFENTSDPKFFCMEGQHEEAMSRLVYAIQEKKAAAMVSGVFGCGKTLLAQALVAALNAGEYASAFIFNPLISHVQLLAEILYQLGDGGKMPLQKTVILRRIQEALIRNHEDGRHTFLIVDEAHLIQDKTLFEELRLLLNLEHKRKFLLTLLLFGQPELRERIFQMKQFEQRIAIRFHLTGLKPDKIGPYVNHRLTVAGAQRPIFLESTFGPIFRCSGGIPRAINQICDLALVVGMEKKLVTIDEETVSDVACEMQLQV